MASFKETFGESAIKVLGSLSHTTLRCQLPRVEYSCPYSTSLETALVQSFNSWWHHPAELESYRKVCWQHPIGTFSTLFFEKLLAETQTDIDLCSSRVGPFICTCMLPEPLSQWAEMEWYGSGIVATLPPLNT